MSSQKKTKGPQRNEITTGIAGEPDSFDKDIKTLKTKVGSKKEELMALKKAPLGDKVTHPAWITSRLPQACPVSYCGETIMIPARCPKGKLFVRNSRMLGKLPKGVIVVPAPEKMVKKA
jgi:hypothetical protein